MLNIVRRFIAWHGGSRAPLSRALSKFARLYVLAWNNARVEINVNGERWLLEQVGKTLHRHGDCYVDVGANVGEWSQLALEMCPGARIFACEPVPEVFASLIKNVRDPNLSAHCVALSNAEGQKTINYIASNPHLSSIETIGVEMPENGSEVTIICRTGDAFCRELGIEHIRFLKVDTEGHDLKVLTGFSEMFSRGAIDVVQFEHNYMSVYSRTLLKDYYEFFGDKYRIGRLLRHAIDFAEYSLQNENFDQANFIAVRTDLLATLRFGK